MKKICENELKDLCGLNVVEMETINGGGFFPAIDTTLVYLIYKWGKFAADYQASLPPNLKK